MNPKTYHKRLTPHNPVRKHVRVRRVNKERMRVKLAKASFVSAPRLTANGQFVKVYIAGQRP